MWGQFRGIVLAVAVCLTLSGCGLWVSKKQSLETSFALGATAERDVRVRPARVYERTIPREGHILPDLYDEENDDLDDDADDVTLRRDRALFLATINNQMVEMRHELMRVATIADQKGAAGWAAFDPKVREFGTAQKLIQRYLLQASDADAAEWNSLKTKISEQLQHIRAVLLEASQQLHRINDDGHFVSDGRRLADHPALVW